MRRFWRLRSGLRRVWVGRRIRELECIFWVAILRADALGLMSIFGVKGLGIDSKDLTRWYFHLFSQSPCPFR